MSELNETKALAIMFSNIKRIKRNDDLITIAESSKYLIDVYGTREKVADILGISPEMIRQFLISLRLPKPVQKIISERKIDSVDVVMHLHSLKNPELQTRAAQLITDIPSKDVRDILRLVKKYNIDIEKAIDTIIDLKPRSMHIIMLDINDESYLTLNKISNLIQIPPAIIAKVVLHAWLLKQQNTEVYS